MQNNNLPITDQRMFALMDFAIQTSMARNATDFFAKIGFARTNYVKVRKGLQSFTVDHIMAACQLTGASADFIYGFTAEIKRKRAAQPMDLLLEGVAAVREELSRVGSNTIRNTATKKKNKIIVLPK